MRSRQKKGAGLRKNRDKWREKILRMIDGGQIKEDSAGEAERDMTPEGLLS